MKKLLFACIIAFGLCTFGQVASAYPYHRQYYRGGPGYRFHRRAYFGRYYGGYGFYGPPRVFVGAFYAPPPFFYGPAPRPEYYEGRIEQRDERSRPSEPIDNSK